MRVISADWVVPVEGPPIRDGAVAIDDGLIADVGTRGELGSDEHYDESVILPGFVNAHTHLEYAVYAGFGDGLRFADWIGLHVERKLRIELEDMEAIARLGALDCLRSGITTVGDCSFSGAAATACADLGLKGTIYLEVFGPTDSPIRERFEPMRERIAGALSDDVRLGISPHAPYTCTIDLYRASAELGLPVATHLAESDDETEFLRTGRGGWESFADMLVPPPGTTGIRALAEAGLLDSNVIAAHCVKADEEEIEILAAHDVAVAHCPRSNGILGCGVAPLTALREAGIRVCIATDSPASTPSFDMFDEMRAAIVGARAREGRPDALTAADALELATLGGARALGVDASRGSIVARKAGGSDRSLARGHAVRPVGRSCYGSRSRRIASWRRRYSRVRQTAVCEGREDMARADRRRAQRTRPAPAPRRSDVVIEDTMFFPRLRRHAKWMFLFLATRLRARLRRLRRRRGWRRLRRRDPRCRRWRWDAVGLRRREARARQPEGRAGIQGPLDGAAGRRQHGRRDRGAPELRPAATEEHRRAARARRALPAAGVGSAGARADPPGPRRHTWRPARSATRSSSSAEARSSPTRSRTR